MPAPPDKLVAPIASPGAQAPSVPPVVATKPTTDVPFKDFRAWTDAALAAGGNQSSGDFLARGVALAKERRAALLQLIVDDPERAIAEAVSPDVRQQLPPQIVAQLEDRVSTRATFGVLATLPPEGSTFMSVPAISRQVVTAEGAAYQAYVYGAALKQPSATNLPISGVALDGKVALSESPVRVMAAGERIAANTPVVEVCPVSGASVPAPNSGVIPADASAVEICGTVHLMCSPGHITEIQQGMRAGLFRVDGSGAARPVDGPVTDSAYNQGTKKILIIRCNFTDAPAESISVAGGQAMLSQTDAFMNENSYGTLRIDLVNSLVTPVLITMPKTKATYTSENNSIGFLSDARAAATAAGYNYLNYDFEFVCYAGIYGFSGQAYVGGRGVWLQSNSTGVACHEWGHNLGLWHANSWIAGNDTIIGAGSNGEYGDSFDTMGSAGAGPYSFNSYHRNRLDWLPNGNIQTAASASATYRIFAYDQTTLTPGQLLAVKTNKDTRDYWLEHRVQWGSVPTVSNGIILHWNSWGSSNGGSQILDMTPGSPGGVGDGGLILGRTFSDVLSGIHITPIAKNATTPESIDVVVNRGLFPTNRPPILSMNASSTSVATGVVVNFTATASDPDGDVLAYYWDFSNGVVGPNSATASTSWGSAGYYNVLCTVSDMKGKTVTKSVLVTVGSPATFTASGTVTDNYAQPMAGVRVHNGLSGGSYRATFTDNSGQYVLTNLAAGSYTLGAVYAGFTGAATANFANPITVGPNATGLNFTGTSLGSMVNVTAPTTPAREAGQIPATFTFTRGQEVPTTAALTVNYTLTGTADKATDYAVNPAPPATGTYSSSTGAGTLVIPIGALSAGLKITPVDDAIAEGTETVVATLNAGTGYQLGGGVSAVLMIDDNDFTDNYTESFTTGTYPFDLDGKRLTFTPLTGTTYQGNCDVALSYPTDPTGGTVLVNNGALVVPVTSGSIQFGYWQVTGLAAQPKVFGTTFSQIFINTAGNVSFESGDTGSDSTPSSHFTSGRRRVSLFGNYMDLTQGGKISYKVITTAGAQRVVVTYENVPRYFTPTLVLNAQVELWASGKITITSLGTTISDGVVGLAGGQAAPNPFYATDLSAYPPTTTTFATWQAAKFTPAELADSTISGAMADPDKDGWTNLMEYALGSDPHVDGNPTGAPTMGQTAGYLTVTFQRDPSHTDLTYLVESSDDALTWTVIAQSTTGAAVSAAPGQTPSLINEVANNGVMTVTVGDTALMSSKVHHFMRLHVTMP
ncbi:hypothetical protein AYO41_02820 [Verrucomicrobia bacterium SCGC AG-212-E04]|nr:hypothetical protein AYO41_02820 [Verrucomicrobia bacterium SCGC AG-212-E04]